MDQVIYRVSGSKRDTVVKAASRLQAHHQTEGKIVRLYRDGLPFAMTQLPTDASIIIIVEPST